MECAQVPKVKQRSVKLKAKGMGSRQYSLGEVGPPINPRAGLRREQAGRGSYRGS
ncbi:unnamed protein product [Arabidopsis lyrata]|uniref:Uncharacterized protein n=1 Tax=Arabidopsis lyrata subsp. lyrata TaxID=81972 RepID=D7KFB4_ARALL|nr:hypothetical protein ARALYDRAFT_887812 [Arabidopsis lyrata subsp. lyrata]CAH8251331.1 unnamed protein product [Arabidopsis lyrata]